MLRVKLRPTGLRWSIGWIFLAASVSAGGERTQPWIRHVIDGSSNGADGLRLHDVNRDGHLDIATGWEEGGRVRVYLNPGPQLVKKAWPAVTVGKVRSAEDAVFADLDNDGNVDVVSSCEGRVRSIYVHWAPKDPSKYLDPRAWTTDAFPVTKGNRRWMFCLPLQVDRKHGIDLVVGAKDAGAQIGWLEAPADPRRLDQWKWHPIYQAGWIMSLAASDVDGDGDLDIVASDRKGPRRGCLWLENPGTDWSEMQRWTEHRIGSHDHEVMFLTLTDLDMDGATDLLVATRDAGLIYHRRLRSSQPEWRAISIPLPKDCGTGKGVATGDIDNDGRLDIVFSCENAKGGKSGVRWLAATNGATASRWEGHEISGREGVKFDLVELLDLDADGDLDVLTCEERENLGVIWYENPFRR